MVATGASDPVVERIIAKDKTPWYRKTNLRSLYLYLLPCCLFIEATGGFDASMMNGLQSLSYWQKYFNEPSGPVLGMLSASYSLGSISALPFVTLLSDHVGRRWSIVFGSAVMMTGAVLQCFSVNGRAISTRYTYSLANVHSDDVDFCSHLPRPWVPLLRCWWISLGW